MKLISDAFDSEYFPRHESERYQRCLRGSTTGLGAPYWDPYARGAIFGPTRGVNSKSVRVRATLRIHRLPDRDVLEAIPQAIGIRLRHALRGRRRSGQQLPDAASTDI